MLPRIGSNDSILGGRQMKAIFNAFCQILLDTLHNSIFVEQAKMRIQDFTRKRKFSFADTVFVVLNKTGRGIRSAIRAYRETVKREEEIYSQQAFSKGRMRIRWEAFQSLFQLSVKEFYENADFKKYRGYRVSAIDGSKFSLPTHPDTVTEFGIQESTGNQAQALCSSLCDVLNGVVIDASLNRYDADERELAKQHIERLAEIRTEKELVLLDRGYPSSDLIKHIEEAGFKYVIRSNAHHAALLIKKAKTDDDVVTHTFSDSKITLTIRLVQVRIPESDETEYLLTNLFDSDFTKDDFLHIYHMRWGIETKYDDLKNKLRIEDFSGTTPLAIRQDFYATMLLLNMAAMLIYDNEAEIDRLHNSGNNKYEYKANVNNVISILKTDVVNMVIHTGTWKGKKLLAKIRRELTAAVVPVRPDRHFERSRSHRANKFPSNHRA